MTVPSRMSRTWWENEAVLAQFRDWLAHTAQEIAAHEAAQAEPALPPWEAGGPAPARPESAAVPAVGLLQVVEALTAMRHELKLQTKGGRGLEEALAAALRGLDEASRQFRAVQARENECAERAARPLAEALAGLDEALWRAGCAFLATHRQAAALLAQRVREAFAADLAGQLWWRRPLRAAGYQRLEQKCIAAVTAANAGEFERLLEGIELIQERTRQELARHGVCRIETAGQPVDPACMTVVALADESEGPPETVVEELRPGYRWRGQMLRFAEVRAVPSRRAAPPLDRLLAETPAGDVSAAVAPPPGPAAFDENCSR